VKTPKTNADSDGNTQKWNGNTILTTNAVLELLPSILSSLREEGFLADDDSNNENKGRPIMQLTSFDYN